MADVNLALTQINEFTARATAPIADGVESKIVIENDSTGFLATYVPENDGGPFMALLGVRQYHKRSGNSFLVMEHYEIEDMFGRRRRPNLCMAHEIRRYGEKRKERFGRLYSNELHVIVSIKNRGRAIAKFPSLSLQVNEPYKLDKFGLDGNGNTGIPRVRTHSLGSEWVSFAGGANDVIHAGASLEVTIVDVHLKGRHIMPTEMQIKHVIGAEGIMLVERTHVIDGKDLILVGHPE